MDANALHPANALVPMDVIFAKLIFCKEAQPLKAVPLTTKGLSTGRSILSRLSQPSKQAKPIFDKTGGQVEITSLRFLQP